MIKTSRLVVDVKLSTEIPLLLLGFIASAFTSPGKLSRTHHFTN